jgi:hypothetical protein
MTATETSALVRVATDPETGALRITIGDRAQQWSRRERLDDRVTVFIAGVTVTGIEITGAELDDDWDAHVDSAIALAMARHPAGRAA